jgi:hypothetical protein
VSTRIFTTLLAVSALALSVAACGDTSGDTVRTPAQDVQGGPAPDAETGGSGDVLALGARAVSQYVDYGAEQTDPTKVGVKVIDVRKGSIADFKDFDLDRKQRRSVPYYVDAKFENLGRFALSRSLLRASIEDTDGTEYRPLNMIVLSGTFKPCPEYSGAKLRPGDSFTGCSAILLPKSAQLDRVRFQGDVTKDPLFWEPN